MMIPDSNGFLSAESCLTCTPEEEKEIIEELTRKAQATEKEGDLYYLISSRWWRDWEKYVSLDDCSRDGLLDIPCRPGQVDNSGLVSGSVNESNGEGILDLQRDLQEKDEYVMVPQEVWKKLSEWYKGGPEIPRQLICVGSNSRSLIVEVYPLCIHVIDARDNSDRVITISRKASVRDLYARVSSLLNVNQPKVQIWDYCQRSKKIKLSERDQTLEEANLFMNQEILVEVRRDGLLSSNFGIDSTGNELALVPSEPSRSSITIAGGPACSNGFSFGWGSDFLHENGLDSTTLRDTDENDDVFSNGTKLEGRGLTGLHNLGNTCFMNSATQCLVHTPPLVECFLQEYKKEINTHNPLGMQGEIAIAFGELLRKLWLSGRTSIAPREFKGTLARFAPQFCGYNQHDSQELLAFLLDGLHEDLNRVKQKPYIEAKDAGGCPDEEFAEECWQNHKARNDSIIVDICQGQYKSTLVCPVCSKVSVTFDPFMYLSLPLPSKSSRTVTVTVFSGDGSKLPMRYTVTIPKQAHCKYLIQALSTECCLETSNSLLLAEIFNNKVYRYINSSEPLSAIRDDDYIVAYKVPRNYAELYRLEILSQTAEQGLIKVTSFHQKLIGVPLIICLPAGSVNGPMIHATVQTVLTPFMRKRFVLSTNDVKANEHDRILNLGSEMLPYSGTHVDQEHGTLSDNEDQCTSDIELNEMDDNPPTFQLAFENGTPIDNDSVQFAGYSQKIFMLWSERERELYDVSYLSDLPRFVHTRYPMQQGRQDAVTLFQCLDAFLKEEPLGPDDMWYCPSCKEHRQATKKLDLWKLPEILVVHLKRFSYSRLYKNKLDTFVKFPIHNLDLSNYVKSKGRSPEAHVYELYAVSNHYGGLGGGHYSAYCKLIEEDRWYHFDDSIVSSVSEDSIATSAAYVLFYRRVKPGS